MAQKSKKRVALALSSGGPRGFAYIGALEELEARGYVYSVTLSRLPIGNFAE